MVANYLWLLLCVPSQPPANYVMTKKTGLPYSLFHQPSQSGASDGFAARRGFTVIELIVCMGVVAVLCGILLPSLRATREASCKLRCASNMHQIGVALVAYGIQSDNRIPPSINAMGAHPLRQELMASRLQDGGMAGTAGWDGLGILVKGGYLGDCQCLYCPSHHGDHAFDRYAADYASKDSAGAQIYTNYHYSGHILRQLGQGLQAPRETAITLDAGSGVLLLTDGLRTLSDFNHESGLNRMMADLSIEWWADTGNQLRNQIPENVTLAGASSAAFDIIWDDINPQQPPEGP
ncbi:MAG: type II secretion system protein [Planctomycetota bacterium]|nr:MAG: type II secretion system protein [Planctomycetota bacterium]